MKQFLYQLHAFVNHGVRTICRQQVYGGNAVLTSSQVRVNERSGIRSLCLHFMTCGIKDLLFFSPLLCCACGLSAEWTK